MIKFLIIYAHPSHVGHHGYLLEQLQTKLKTKNIEATLIDLYAINYEPILKDSELYSSGRRAVSEENLEFQKQIKEANCLVFIYPTWWQNMPAILKGFIDRVFTAEFAFVYKNGLPVGLLKGKKAAIFTAAGGPRWYSLFLTNNSAVSILTKYVLNFCALKTKGFYFGSAKLLDEMAKNKLQKIADKMIAYLT
ncbi:MAG: NAD(P)H-dependent oxidoreductase [Patescibacteria group bacterium]